MTYRHRTRHLILGLNPDKLIEEGGWAVEADGSVWCSPLPHNAHKLLDNLNDAAGLVARSMPAVMLDPRRPPGPNGLYLVPVTDAERQRREHFVASGGLFEGEVPNETRPGPSAERHDPPAPTAPGAPAVPVESEPTDWLEGW